MKNLCVNGEAITNSYHETEPDRFSPNHAFDGTIVNSYSSHSYTGDNKPYIGYHFPKTVKILKMYLIQGATSSYGQYAKNLYVIYSDDGINWVDAKYVTNLSGSYNSETGEFDIIYTIDLEEDYGVHEYWGLQLRENVSGGPSQYPWQVRELEMHGNSLTKDLIKNKILNHELIQKCVIPYEEE